MRQLYFVWKRFFHLVKQYFHGELANKFCVEEFIYWKKTGIYEKTSNVRRRADSPANGTLVNKYVGADQLWPPYWIMQLSDIEYYMNIRQPTPPPPRNLTPSCFYISDVNSWTNRGSQTITSSWTSILCLKILCGTRERWLFLNTTCLRSLETLKPLYLTKIQNLAIL